MERFRTFDIILRILAGYFIVQIQLACVFFGFIFSYPIHLTHQQSVALAFTNMVLFAWIIWPHKLEKLISGPSLLRLLIVRGPIYFFAVAYLLVFLWLRLRRF
jgi:hypothetical protein